MRVRVRGEGRGERGEGHKNVKNNVHIYFDHHIRGRVRSMKRKPQQKS